MSGLQLLIIGLSRVTLERHVLAVELGFTHVRLVEVKEYYRKSVPQWFTFAASVVVGVGSTRNFASAQLAMEREKFFTLLRLRQH
jgi:hypothetical protein